MVNYQQPIQIQPSKNQKPFSQLFATLLKSTSNFKDFERKMTFKAHVFQKLRTAKDMVR